jgi:hypothetical protein
MNILKAKEQNEEDRTEKNEHPNLLIKSFSVSTICLKDTFATHKDWGKHHFGINFFEHVQAQNIFNFQEKNANEEEI